MQDVNIKKLLFEFASGSVLSFIVFIAFNGVNLVNPNSFDTFYFFIFILFGAPLGSTFGILIVDKFIYKYKSWNIMGIILSITFGIIWNYIFGSMIFIRSKISSMNTLLIIIVLLTVFICMIAFYISIFLKNIIPLVSSFSPIDVKFIKLFPFFKVIKKNQSD